MADQRVLASALGIAIALGLLALAHPADFSRGHRDVIARFVRFPHRSTVLGRVSSAEELAFLQTPGSRF